jgi:hypothetical protein
MRKIGIAWGLALVAVLLLVSTSLAQAETLTLSLSRDWGYGGFGGDIQGTFSFHARASSTISRVEFYIDELKIGEDTSAPFDLQFVTDNYPVGAHELYAIGFTADDRSIRSQSIRATFVSATEGGQAAMKFIIPLFAVIFGAMALAAIIPLLSGRKTVPVTSGAQRTYTFGGGICPKCGRPFAFHMLGLNLLASKFDRCPYCGRWSAVRHASLPELRAAERAELDAAQEQIPEASAEEKLKKELEDSKFQGL